MREKIKGVYEIFNTVNGKRYIGSSVNIKIRWRGHTATLKSGKSQSIKLQNAWNKYGEQSFKFNIVEVVDGNKEILYKREQYWMDFYDSVKNGYNMCPASGSVAGIKRSEETKAKLSKAITGKQHSEETKHKISESRKLKTISEETRRRMSEAQKGRKHSLETREKISNSAKGRLFSDDTKEKLSERNTGKIPSAETRAKISAANKGRKHTEESKAKMSESMKKRWEERKSLKTTT